MAFFSIIKILLICFWLGKVLFQLFFLAHHSQVYCGSDYLLSQICSFGQCDYLLNFFKILIARVKEKGRCHLKVIV